MRGKTMFNVVGVLFAAAVIGIVASGPAYKWKARSFSKEWMRIGSTAELRAWALSLISSGISARDDYYIRFAKNQPDLPACLLGHSDGPPNYIFIVRGEGTDHDHVEVTWGGGFGHWGLLIGRESFQPGSDVYSVEWCPGIYVWHEMQ